MMEHPSNIALVCPNCAKKPNPKFKEMPLDFFRKKYCKLAFPCPDGRNEYMWVHVVRCAKNGKSKTGHELLGVLDNTPIFAEFNRGDQFEFNRDEIIEVLE